MGTDEQTRAKLLALAATLARIARHCTFERRGRDKATNEVRLAVVFSVPRETLDKLEKEQGNSWWQWNNGGETTPKDNTAAAVLNAAIDRGASPEVLEGIAERVVARKNVEEAVPLPSLDDLVIDADNVGPKPLRKRRKKMAQAAQRATLLAEESELKELVTTEPTDLDLGEFSV